MSAPYSCGCCGGRPRYLCRGCDHVIASLTGCACYCKPDGRPTNPVPYQPKREIVRLDWTRERGRGFWLLMHGVKVVWTLPVGMRWVRARRPARRRAR
jgi:hypothetical protein